MLNFKKIKNKLIAILVAMVIMVLPIFSGVAMAKPLLQNKPPAISSVTTEQGVAFKDKTINSEKYKQLEKKYEFKTDQVSVKQLSASYDNMKLVFVPIKDNTGEDYSKYVGFYDKNGDFKNSLLLNFTKQNNIIHMYSELNGVVCEADITEQGEIVSGSLIGADGISKDIDSFIKKSSVDKGPGIISTLFGAKNVFAGDGFACVDNCLASLGVANWMLAAIAVVCAFACVGTAGAGCYPCIAAMGLVLGNELTYCMQSCGYDTTPIN